MSNEEKIKVTPEGRKDIWIPEKDSLVKYIKAKKLKRIHNFIPSGMMLLGADHEVKSVIQDIEAADRLAIFTDKQMNMGHSLAVIKNEKLECFDIGQITEANLLI